MIPTTGQWIKTITNVGELIKVYKTELAPRFDATPIDELTLHLPVGIKTRDILSADLYGDFDENDTKLPIACPLSCLKSDITNFTKPLIIKTRQDIEQGLNRLI